MSTPKTSHPLQRAGVSQNQRNLAALSPAYAPLDEHSESDLLEYVWELAKVFVYHDVKHDSLWKSDWLDFMRLSLPLQLALIGNYDTDRIETEFLEAVDNFEQGLGQGNIEPLFRKVADIALLLNRWRQNLPENTPLATDLDALIRNDLNFALSRFVRVANDAQKKLNTGTFSPLQMLEELPASSVWNIMTGDLLPTGLQLPGAAQAKGTKRARMAYFRGQISEIFSVFWQGLRRIVLLAQSPAYREKSLDAISDLSAHTGLMVAFMRVFRLLQDDLNRIPERHLDFYLRDVLGLKPLPAVPDKAHLVVELDKSFPRHLVPGGKQFKAGAKDQNKADIIFAPGEETMLNQAKVDSLRTVFRYRPDGNTLHGIFSAIAADKFDGRSVPFPEADKVRWKTLGAKTAPDASDNAVARTGFFIASPVLLLREGNATVQVDLTFTGTAPANANLTPLFRVFYSGEKTWEDATGYTKGADSFEVSVISGNTIKVRFVVPAGKPLTFSDPKNLKIDYGTTDPMLKLELGDPSADWAAYDALCNIKITDIGITVQDVALRNLLLSNDEGPVDGNKPFLPFGAMPKVGASLMIGSDEAFRKNLTGLRFEVLWDKLNVADISTIYTDYSNPKTNSDFQATTSILANGAWTMSEAGKNLFHATDARLKRDITVNSYSSVPRLGADLQPFSALSTDGFVKLALAPIDFKHAEYPQLLIKSAMKGNDQMQQDILNLLTPVQTSININYLNAPLAGKDEILNIDSAYDIAIGNINNYFTPNNPPHEPYTPTIREFALVYSATENWSGGQMHFGHLYPFEEQNHARKAAADVPSLLPAFHQDNTGLLPGLAPVFEGSLLVGLKNLEPGSTLNLLFQVAEATADPDIALIHMKWWYLAGNEWRILRPDVEVLEDATHLLTASGLVRFPLPFDIGTAGTTILPADRHWLRVSLESGVRGVADTVAVHAQAIRASAVLSAENDAGRLAEPLPAGSLGKPLESEAALKKISQPYDSFGGQAPESAVRFHLRASERLRHKGRAVTLYDYERIVLQAFPEIYKVKCLPHTRVLPGGNLLTEAPGYVTLVVIPEIARVSFAEKLQPRASRALLESVELYLKQRATPFARIDVVNPVFQLLDVQANVKFNKGKDKVFYRLQLEEDIRRFLTPWAYGELDKLSFGGKIFQSSILHFAEKLDYVDYLTDFTLRESVAGSVPQTVIAARDERSILTFNDADWGDPVEPCPPNAIDPTKKGLGYDPVSVLQIA